MNLINAVVTNQIQSGLYCMYMETFTVRCEAKILHTQEELAAQPARTH